MAFVDSAPAVEAEAGLRADRVGAARAGAGAVAAARLDLVVRVLAGQPGARGGRAPADRRGVHGRTADADGGTGRRRRAAVGGEGARAHPARGPRRAPRSIADGPGGARERGRHAAATSTSPPNAVPRRAARGGQPAVSADRGVDGRRGHGVGPRRPRARARGHRGESGDGFPGGPRPRCGAASIRRSSCSRCGWFRPRCASGRRPPSRSGPTSEPSVLRNSFQFAVCSSRLQFQTEIEL